MSEKWDKRFLDLAEHVAQWSKDPSTKCGTVIVRPDKTIASLGYNGFPRGIEDKQELYDNREEKYKRVVHGEMNAILNARESLMGYTLYTHPGPCSCERCTVHIIQAGIKRVVCANKGRSMMNRWADSYKLSIELYEEAGVEYEVVE
jgi:dCMP deaminase